MKWKLEIRKASGDLVEVVEKPSPDACRAYATKTRKRDTGYATDLRFDIFTPTGGAHMHSVEAGSWRMKWVDGARVVPPS